MVVEIARTYYPEWTKGLLMINDVIICHTLELAWRDNERNVSCIPEGIYPISWRQSSRYREHLLIEDVPDRNYILLHPANDARKELKGCIAPVMQLTGGGKGLHSRLALGAIMLNLAQQNYQDCFIKIYEAIEFGA